MSSCAGLPYLFGLSARKVYPASLVTLGAVRSYRTFSPLSAPNLRFEADGLFSVALSVSAPYLRYETNPSR